MLLKSCSYGCSLSSLRRSSVKAHRRSHTLPGNSRWLCVKRSIKIVNLYLEGDSAGGSAKQGRNVISRPSSHFEERYWILSKPVSIKSSNEQIKISSPLSDVKSVIHLTSPKLVITVSSSWRMPDVDGAHIRTLLLILYRFMRPLIDAGYLIPLSHHSTSSQKERSLVCVVKKKTRNHRKKMTSKQKVSNATRSLRWTHKTTFLGNDHGSSSSRQRHSWRSMMQKKLMKSSASSWAQKFHHADGLSSLVRRVSRIWIFSIPSFRGRPSGIGIHCFRYGFSRCSYYQLLSTSVWHKNSHLWVLKFTGLPWSSRWSDNRDLEEWVRSGLFSRRTEAYHLSGSSS